MAKIQDVRPPQAPPDFRMFVLGKGEKFHCACHNVNYYHGDTFHVSVTDSAICLTCRDCGVERVVIVNRLVEPDEPRA